MPFGVGDAIAAGIKVLDKFIPDPAERVRAEAQLRADLLQWDKAQSDVNAIEAANASLFVSGWRPSIGWSCSAAFAFYFVIAPLITWLATMAGHNVSMPVFNIEALMTMTSGMLGLAGLRTFEKAKGVA